MRTALRIAMASLLSFSSAALFAIDYGLEISNQSSMIVQADVVASQSNRARAWFSAPLPAGLSLRLSGFYDFSGNFTLTDGSGEVVPLRLDADLIELSGSAVGLLVPSSLLRFSVGRIAASDFSGRVVSGPSDGTRAELVLGNATYRAWLGYRGLLYKEDARSFLDIDDDSIYSDKEKYFAPSRAFAGVGIRFSEIFGSQDAGAELWTQTDLGTGSTKTDTAYFEPYLEGRLGRALRWRAWSVTELGYDGEDFLAMGAGTMLRLSMPELNSFRLTQTLAWASGASGPFRAFTPIRQGPIGSASPFSFTDILSVGLDAALSPLRLLSANAGAAALYRSSDNPPSGGGLRDDATGRLLGMEFSAGASFDLSSDSKLDFSCGVFAPNTVDVYPDDTKLRWTASISASLEI